MEIIIITTILIVVFVGIKIFKNNIFSACKDNDIEKVKKFIENGADINNTTSLENDTLLTIALRSENNEIAKYLINKGSDVNHKTRIGVTPLMLAKDVEIVKMLIENEANVNYTFAGIESVLIGSCKEGNLEKVKLLLNSGVNMYFPTYIENDPIKTASDYNRNEIVKYLIEFKNNLRNKICSNSLEIDVVYSSEDSIQIFSKYFIWVDNNSLVMSLIANNSMIKEIKLDNIDFFTVDGDLIQELEISGGGGYNLSIPGVVIGGLIAGNVGAILGGRTSVKEIQSNTKTIDNRELILFYKDENNQYQIIKFNYAHLNILRRLISSKDYDSIKNVKIASSDDNKTNKLRELASLKNDKIITEEEFLKEKEKILNS